jgi:hypothetical protein
MSGLRESGGVVVDCCWCLRVGGEIWNMEGQD